MQGMKSLFLLLAILCLSSVAVNAKAQSIGSCYAQLRSDQGRPDPQKTYFIMVDQTIKLDAPLRKNLSNQVRHIIKPGIAYKIIAFSSYLRGGHYFNLVAKGMFEPDLPDYKRNDISKPLLQRFDHCRKIQMRRNVKQITRALKKILNEASGDLPRTDILSSLKNVSDIIRQTPGSKVLLLVSDMLENSAVTSFYYHGRIRRIDPDRELKKIKKQNMVAHLHGTDVYVLGGGLVFSRKGARTTYVDPITLKRLESFWRSYFETAGAQVKGFGRPMLISPME